jgi:hypothetical protein
MLDEKPRRELESITDRSDLGLNPHDLGVPTVGDPERTPTGRGPRNVWNPEGVTTRNAVGRMGRRQSVSADRRRCSWRGPAGAW